MRRIAPRARIECRPDLVLQEVPEIQSGKNRVGPRVFEVRDLDEGLHRVNSAGGRLVTRVDNEFGSHIVCADPDGNEFCLTHP